MIMKQQRIFRERFTTELVKNIEAGSAISKFRESQIIFDREKDTLILPSVEEPGGLLVEMEKNINDDFSSAITLYEAYKDLKHLDAVSPSFWNYLSLVDLYPILLKRWPAVYEGVSDNPTSYILEHYIVKSSSKLLRAHLSGLWWSVHLSIDSERDDPYELTKVLFWNQTLRTRTMGNYKMSRYKESVIGLLEYCLDRGKGSFQSFEKEHQELTEYLNIVGGTKPLPFFNRDKIKRMLTSKFGKGESTPVG